MRSRPARLAGVTLALAGCGHTSEASRRAIHADVDAFNGENEARAFAQALAAAPATRRTHAWSATTTPTDVHVHGVVRSATAMATRP